MQHSCVCRTKQIKCFSLLRPPPHLLDSVLHAKTGPYYSVTLWPALISITLSLIGQHLRSCVLRESRVWVPSALSYSGWWNLSSCRTLTLHTVCSRGYFKRAYKAVIFIIFMRYSCRTALCKYIAHAEHTNSYIIAKSAISCWAAIVQYDLRLLQCSVQCEVLSGLCTVSRMQKLPMF